MRHAKPSTMRPRTTYDALAHDRPQQSVQVVSGRAQHRMQCIAPGCLAAPAMIHPVIGLQVPDHSDQAPSPLRFLNS